MILQKKKKLKAIMNIFNLFTKKDKLKKECWDYLSGWSDTRLSLEDKKPYLQSTNDYDFLKLMATSVNRMDYMNSCLLGLIANIGETQPNLLTEQEQKNSYRFSLFYNNLVVSKAKDFFFRETPNRALEEPYFSSDQETYVQAKRLIKSLNRVEKWQKKDIGKFKEDLGKYYFLLPFLYEFIYNKEKEEGVFLRFEYNQNTFNDLINVIKKDIEEINTEEDYRKKTHDIVVKILRKQILEEDEQKTTKNEVATKQYQKFVSVLTDEQKTIEPYTWRICNILWKIDGFIQDADELNSKENEQARFQSIKEALVKFINESEELYSRSYEQSSNDFIKIFEIESRLFRRLYDEDETGNAPVRKTFDKENAYLLRVKSLEEVESIFSTIKAYLKEISTIEKSKFISTDINWIYRKLEVSHWHKERKLEDLLECLSGEELEQLFVLYASSANQQYENIIGAYSSGVFLAHVINFYNKKSDIPVWLYKVFPYVGVHPLHDNHKHERLNKNTLICDESIKTGFSMATYQARLSRNSKHGKAASPKILTLLNFTQYKRTVELGGEIDSLLSIQKNGQVMLNRSVSKEELTIPDIKLAKSLSENEIEKLYQLMRGDKKNATDYLDKTPILCNTISVIGISKRMKSNIIKYYNNNNLKEILLYSPSKEGRTLMLMTAYLLKLDNYKVKMGSGAWKKYQPTNNTNKNETQCAVAIDLSHNTGYTLKSGIEDFTEKTDINTLEYFNLILCAGKKQKRNE
jgi:hypothetical protein